MVNLQTRGLEFSESELVCVLEIVFASSQTSKFQSASARVRPRLRAHLRNRFVCLRGASACARARLRASARATARARAKIFTMSSRAFI